jgi:hypothetical protein
MEAALSDQNYQQQLDRELVKQLNDAKYASLMSRTVSDPARTLIDCLTSRVESEEKKERRSRKNKRSEKAHSALRRGWKDLSVTCYALTLTRNRAGGSIIH